MKDFTGYTLNEKQAKIIAELVDCHRRSLEIVRKDGHYADLAAEQEEYMGLSSDFLKSIGAIRKPVF